MTLTFEQIAQLVCDHTGKRINLPNFTIEELADFAHAVQRLVEENQKPVAWMRKWAADGETPVKERNAKGRMVWADKFKFLPVTEKKLFADDVPLILGARPMKGDTHD